MPWRSPSVCTTPGCAGLAAAGRGQCPGCIRKRRQQRARIDATYDTVWASTSEAFLRAHPWCQEPGCTQRSAETHHRDGLGPSGPRGHDWSNLEALCKRHHSIRTAQATGFHRR
jgi:5-methylcytosine-specific restriction enzyme A